MVEFRSIPTVIFCAALWMTGAQAQQISSVEHGATFERDKLAPNMWISVKGTDLADAQYSATSVPLPTKLGPTAVELDGTPLPLNYINSKQINAVLPASTALGAHTLTVKRDGKPSVSTTVNVAATNPGIFTWYGQAIAQNGNFEFVSTTNQGVLLKPGDVLNVYGTGFGNAIAQGDLLVIPNTQVKLTLQDGTNIPLEQLGTYKSKQYILDQSIARLPAELPTTAAYLQVCRDNVCSPKAAIPLWDGKSQSFSLQMRDIDNPGTLVTDPMVLTNKTTGQTTTITPAGNLYVANFTAKATDTVEASITSERFYHWKRTSRYNQFFAYEDRLINFPDPTP